MYARETLFAHFARFRAVSGWHLYGCTGESIYVSVSFRFVAFLNVNKNAEVSSCVTNTDSPWMTSQKALYNKLSS